MDKPPVAWTLRDGDLPSSQILGAEPRLQGLENNAYFRMLTFLGRQKRGNRHLKNIMVVPFPVKGAADSRFRDLVHAGVPARDFVLAIWGFGVARNQREKREFGEAFAALVLFSINGFIVWAGRRFSGDLGPILGWIGLLTTFIFIISLTVGTRFYPGQVLLLNWKWQLAGSRKYLEDREGGFRGRSRAIGRYIRIAVYFSLVTGPPLVVYGLLVSNYQRFALRFVNSYGAVALFGIVAWLLGYFVGLAIALATNSRLERIYAAMISDMEIVREFYQADRVRREQI